MKQAYSYKGMTKDLAKSKKGPEYYYDAKNDIAAPFSKEPVFMIFSNIKK